LRTRILAVASALALACGEGDLRPPLDDAVGYVRGEGLELTEPDLAASLGGELALVFSPSTARAIA
jgi:hypothetical protein